MTINNIIRFACLILLFGFFILAMRDAGQSTASNENFSPVLSDNTEFYGCRTKNYDRFYEHVSNKYHITAHNESTADNGVFIGTPNVTYGSNNDVGDEYPYSAKYDSKTIFMP